MKPTRILLYVIVSISSMISCTDKKKNDIEKTIAIENWTDSIFHEYFDGTYKYDTIEKSGGVRLRIKQRNKNREEYILIDNADTLVKIVTIFEPNIKIIKEYCVLNKNPKTYLRIQIDGKTSGKVTEKYCFADSVSYKYYLNDTLIETMTIINGDTITVKN